MGNLEAILARRIGLLEESSLRAPVTEVIRSQDAVTGLSSFVREVPFRRLFHSIPADVSAGPANAGATDPSMVSTQPPTLSGMLEATLRDEQQAMAERAWSGFQAGQYRRASRAFEAVVTLNPDDLSSRVGALFCALSNESMRTAVVMLGITARHDTSPFLSTLNVTDRYGSPAEAREVRLRCELFAQRNRSPESTGLYAFVLWYLGEQEAAMGVASSLESDYPGTIFAAWRAKMESARKLPREEDQPS